MSDFYCEVCGSKRDNIFCGMNEKGVYAKMARERIDDPNWERKKRKERRLERKAEGTGKLRKWFE